MAFATSPTTADQSVFYLRKTMASLETIIPMMEMNPVDISSGEKKQKDKQDADSRYFFDPKKLNEIKQQKPWMKEPKYFEKVALSPSALIKIMMHCQSGVKKGIDKGGNPIEVMGMLLGRPDPDTPKTLVVTDAFPLPIEGFETRVVADDANVVNHMIQLGECLEATRNEKFMGWYHSHPFDLGDNSHCFFSQTDLSTQLQWQRAEDPHGNPFVGIVVDPLRSLHQGVPELKAFRAYPPEYTSPIENECPNGTIELSEQRRLELWGSCWQRYYELEIEFFMSTHAQKVLQQLTQDYLWMRTLVQRDPDQGKSLPEKLKKAAQPIRTATSSARSSEVSGGMRLAGSSGVSINAESVKKTVDQVVSLANEEVKTNLLDGVKKQVFSVSK